MNEKEKKQQQPQKKKKPKPKQFILRDDAVYFPAPKVILPTQVCLSYLIPQTPNH